MGEKRGMQFLSDLSNLAFGFAVDKKLERRSWDDGFCV
jgi:hypothetical protein